MKRYVKLLCSALLVSMLCLSGCGGNSEPSVSGGQNQNNDTSSVVSDGQQESTAEPSDEPEESTEENTVPDIEDPTPDNEGEYINGLLVYNGVAYEQFFGNDDMAENYADVMSTIRNSLDDSIKIYNVLVPTHCGVTLPDKFKDTVSSQEDYLNKITSSYSADGIIPVNTYNTLMQHRDEYLYFNTDHHWTGRAAYYAYADFCKTASVDAIPLESMTAKKIEGYWGSLADSDVDGLNNLKEDYVEYFTVDKDIDTMLYDDEGNELYDPQYKKRLFHSLGLFLFSYLANGANMADIVKLRYDDFYYNHEQKAMRFIRQKTMRETDGMEVIFPILPQMQVILDRIARKPQRGALVFDIIKEGMTETRIKEIVSCENANINARMENVAKMLGMEERPTPTWCRHSYATNLRDAGVSTEYISTMMGHTMTSGSATTLNYLSRYNMATMVTNNSKLLSTKDKSQKKAELVERLMEMDQEKLEAMLKLMG